MSTHGGRAAATGTTAPDVSMPDVSRTSTPAPGPVPMCTILDLAQIDDFVFTATAWSNEVRVFGGEVAAQSLAAAGRTVPTDRRVHSLHAYFLHPGDPSQPIRYEVDPIRDGGSFTTRRTVATQNGEAIFHLSSSFQVPEDGYEHQQYPMESVPPEDLPPAEVTMAEADETTRVWFANLTRRFPLELRIVEQLPRVATIRGEVAPARQRFWFRTSERLPDEPLLHSCAATYTSDLFLLSVSLPPHREYIGKPGLQFASLDHAVWFHAPFRADEWLFYDQEGLWAGGGRALSRGRLYDRSGRLVASVIQEGLVRRRHRS